MVVSGYASPDCGPGSRARGVRCHVVCRRLRGRIGFRDVIGTHQGNLHDVRRSLRRYRSVRSGPRHPPNAGRRHYSDGQVEYGTIGLHRPPSAHQLRLPSAKRKLQIFGRLSLVLSNDSREEDLWVCEPLW